MLVSKLCTFLFYFCHVSFPPFYAFIMSYFCDIFKFTFRHFSLFFKFNFQLLAFSKLFFVLFYRRLYSFLSCFSDIIMLLLKMKGGIYMDFKDKLKDFRKKNSLTQAEFAKKYGFSRTTITELESGRKKPTLKMIEKIAKATNTKTVEWLDEKENIEIKNFEGLKMVFDKLQETGDIDEEGNMNQKAKTFIFKMVEAEIKLLAQQKKNKEKN
ncbi:XRE family transcriptional regulator [Clostridium perfringens]